ncbi:MAG TPA: two-component regulator propeller domain-containing protein [Bacteroidales bacterium]|nr:two-component regulator propeller domain-containing protein [Bacteroidales bacterium]
MSHIKFDHSRAGSIVWLLVFFAVASPTVTGQKYFFDNYSVKQGLSEQKVYTLFQDSRDYIWLGTPSGVSRFDGKKFENFSSKDGLATGGVKCIRQDRSGNIWFGHMNGGGISRFNGQVFEQAVFDSVTFSNDISSIAITDSSLWLTTIRDGVIKADFPITDIKHIRARQFKGKDNLSDQVSGSIVNHEGDFICIADIGMRRYNRKEHKFENYRMPHLTTYFSTICILNDSKGNIWFGTYKGGLYKYVMSESRMDFFDLPKLGVKSNWVSCLTEDSRGRIWIGTWGAGVAVFEGDSVRKFTEDNGLKATKIYSILEDVEGNILISDQTNGLTIYKGDAFVTINEKEILPDPNVNAITQDETGATWFGTNAGILRFWPSAKKKPLIYNQEKSAISNEIRFFRKDKDGNIWIGTNDQGVIMFNVKKDRFESQPYINSSLPREGMVTAMEIDRQNHLWIGTLEGVAVGTIGENNFQRYLSLGGVNVPSITSLYCDPEGYMWVGTEPMPGKPGLVRINPENQKESLPVTSLHGVIPKTLLMNGSGILWVGTGEGVFALKNDSVLYNISQEDGLLSNSINLLTDAGDGSIYIGANNGLNRFFPGSRRIYSYTERNGFTGIETRPNSVYKNIEGDIWFGTANGATRLRQSRFFSKGLDPLTHILRMQVNYEPKDMVAGMKLSFKQRSVLFDYSSICLTNPDIVRYKVRLDGADNDWRPVTDQTRAIYSALPAGKYTFNVIARNSEGLWNSKPVTFMFTIKPPFYRTWWFILITLVVIVILVISYIQIRERNLIREKIILEEKVKERTAEVVQKSQIIEEKNRDITASIRYAERIQRAMLPNVEALKDTFVLYLPKDIVSGDFYWMYDNGDYLFLAAVDCTGHGVPGAFMSIIGHNSLNKVVREYGLTRPAAILDQLNIEVNKAILLSQEKGINDGMDLTLIVFNRKENKLELAGAYNPLYQVRNGEVIVHKTDRFAIGMATLEQKKTFNNIGVDIQPGDMLYMCSDGYADQFGSHEVKKFKTVNIKRIIGEIWSIPVQDQKSRLEKEIMDWKGELAQVDDIMFIGMKIPG